MKRYLFLKLGLTILVFAAASPRSQVPENTASTRDENRRSNVNQNGPQSAAPIDQRGGDLKPNTKEYQGVMGKPGVDFPVLTYIPRTKFTCRSKKSGYYADLDTNCQVFHICDEGRKVSFLCPNGTIFQQSDLICDWWFKVDCASSPNLYDESAEQLHEENLKRKENRRVQQQERRTKLQNHQNSKNINNIQPLPNTEQLNVRPAQSIPQYSNARAGTNPTENYNNVRPDNRQGREYVKVRKVVTNQRNHQNYSKKDINHYTEQYQHQRSFDLKETQEPSETASFVNNRYNSETQKSYYNYNDVREKTTYTSPKYYDATERNRGTRTYTQKNVAESIKTTTQHTIYSPTVPPFTSRHTTRTPTTVPLTQPRVNPSKNKGFYITKDYSTTPRSYQQSIFPKLIIDSLHTTPAAVHPTYRPLVASEIIAGSREIQETDETSSFVTTTESGRTPKQLVYTTSAPREEKIRTATPSIPTPFKLSQYTYLPKSTDSTPIPTIPTEYTTVSPVTDNLNNMIKTLQELDSNIPEVEQNLGSRPGLNIPPSAGPKTLHSLAIYFATAIDNLVTNTTEDTTPPPDNDNAKVTLLSRTTQEKYNSLFSPEKAGNETKEREDKSIDLKDLVELDASNNDLDGQQSRGLVNSTPRIRQLAQVFTQALSAYLDDPDTFKKVLEEIRPTEPPLTVDVTTPTSTEYRSYTKEEDEVLDFSDVDKSTSKPTRNDITTPRPTPNSLALDLNNRLKISTTVPDDEDITEDYFPASENLDDINLKATAKPYGFGVKPENSTPINVPQIPATGFKNYYQQPSDSLLPPFKISLLDPEINSSFTTNEESLQSAYSQSFISHSNTVNDRTGKSFKVDITTTEFPTTYDYTSTPETTTTIEPTTYRPRQSQTELNRQYYDAVPIYNRNRIETTTNFETTTRQYETTTTDKNLDTTTSRYRYETTTDRNPDTTTNRYDTTTRNFYTTTDRNPYTTTSRYEASTRYPETTTNRYETTTYNAPTTVLPYRKGKSRNRFETTTDYTTTDLYKNRYETTTNRNYETTNFYQKTTDFNRYDATTDFSRTTTDYQKTTDANTEYYNHKYETTTDSSTYPTESATTTKPVPDNHWSTSPEVTKLWESTLYLDPLLINQNLESRFGKSLSLETDSPTTDHTTTEYNNEDIVDIRFTTEDYRTTTNPPFTTVIDLGIHNLLNSTELEIASSQAKQIFGNLDIAEQDLLIEKMKEAESNSTVRRLILLLVSTCDASLSNNKTVQETRNSILNALLNLPSEDNNHRFGRKYEETTTIEYSTTTTVPETSTLPLQQNLAIVNNTLDVKDVHQDTRALELLRSLYSLAAKWGKK